MGVEGKKLARRVPANGSIIGRDAIIAQIIEQLEEGMSLTEICMFEGMPDRRTVQKWMGEKPAIDAAVTRAREVGFAARADRVMVEVRDLARVDAQAGRLLLDSERWYLGKLSNAFSDTKRSEMKLEVGLSPEAMAWFGRAK